MADEPSQSLPLCILLSSISGVLRVCATMVLAYPDYLAKKSGIPSTTGSTLYIAAHLLILGVAAVLSIFGTIYGPVSIAVPVTTGVCLLCNVIAMGIVLRMRAFDKAQRTGTYVVFFAILSLVDVGPGVQDGQDALDLLSTPLASFWSLLVTVLMILSAVGTVQLLRDGTTASSPSSSWSKANATLILATGCTMSNVGMATASKTFATLQGLAFDAALLYYLMATFLGVLFSVVSATACDQGIFTPLASVALIITNMMTGLLIWEDGKVLNTPLAYLCAVLLMCCGVYLLAEVDVLEKFSRKALATIVLPGETQMTSISSTDGAAYGAISQTTDEPEGATEAEDDLLIWQATLS